MFCPKLVTFDVNGTLICNNSWYELNLAMGVTEQEDQRLLERAERGEISSAEGNTELLAAYRQKGDCSRAAIEHVLFGYQLSRGAEQAIEYCEDKGYEVALISGAMDMLVESVAKRLRVDYWRSGARFVFDADGSLVDVVSEEDEAEGKLANLSSLCVELGIDMVNVVHIGDGSNDKKIYEEIEHGVALEDSSVKELAWCTIDSLNDIRYII